MPQWTTEAMNRRLVRYADLEPSRTALFDTKTPGPGESERFSIIDPAASTSTGQHGHIREQHGFSIGGARQLSGCVTPQYSHDTVEVFVVHSGHWRLHFGPNQEGGSLDLAPGNVASVSTNLFRGFSKLDEGKGFLWIVRGPNDPEFETWTPAVLEAAADSGWKLAKAGFLIDTTSGYPALKDLKPEESPDFALVAEMKTHSMEERLIGVVRAETMRPNPASPLAGEGVEEAGVIVPRATSDRFPAGPILDWWAHDLNLRRLTLQSGAYVPMHARAEAEVLLAQSGTVEISWDTGALLMGAGDTLSLPVGLQHAFRNTASVPAVLFVVRGTEDPAMPIFASAPVAQVQVGQLH